MTCLPPCPSLHTSLPASPPPPPLSLSLSPSGNVVEWKYPDVVNLEGIEFKCIASGSHNIPKDFV